MKNGSNKQNNMKVNTYNIGGEIIRDTAVYQVIDNNFLNNLTLSQTLLYSGQHTSGHKHDGLEEVYFFNEGCGVMELDDKQFEVQRGDIVLIPAGAFHKVYNDSTNDLLFTCVFQKYDR
jgi:mannose-6-phosphate isomerase-like protein (cupin superfamily)